MTTTLVIEGLGAALPTRVVPNAELVDQLGVTDEWVQRRTGIRQRRYVEPGVTTGDLATTAGGNAMKSASWDGMDAVVVATSTPDRICPATAPDVASRLSDGQPLAFDIAAVCSGFVYGLAVCAGLVAAGLAQRVLLIGSETNSYFIRQHPESRGPAVLFGDGAGAVALRAGSPDEPGAVGPIDLGSDGSRTDLIRINSGGSRERSRAILALEPDPTDPYMTMEGQEVYRRGIAHMVESSQRVLKTAGMTTADVDRFVAHQANLRLLDQVAEKLDIGPERRLSNVTTVGNTGAASIPLALAEECLDGKLRAGHRLLMTAFGGGLTWGSALMTWPDLPSIVTNH